MALTDTSYPERVLIVLNLDGSLKGAHQERLREVKDGDVLLSVMQLPAEPLTADALAAVLPAHAALAAQVQALTDQVTAAVSAMDAAVAAKEAAEAHVTSLQEQVQQLQNPGGIVNGVPQQVTNYQARSALIMAGMFEAVDAAVKAQGPGSQAYQAWEYANVYLRSSPFIAEMGAILGLTSEQIDALFVAAAQVP